MKNSRRLLSLGTAVLAATARQGAVTFYTSKAAFDGAMSTTLLEDFESFLRRIPRWRLSRTTA